MTSWHSSVFHATTSPYVQAQQFQLGEQVQLRLRTALDAPIQAVYIRTAPDGEQTFLPMEKQTPSDSIQWWQGNITLSMPSTGYRFWILTAAGGWWYSQMGLQRSTPRDATDFRLLADFAAPTWVRSSVFYQIFPDRFADGDPSNNVQTGEYSAYGTPVIAREWGQTPRSHKESGAVEFFGGDLQGITQHLDYIQELGINALYLNPIFTAPSNHKYDTGNYYEVDPHFGGEQAFIELRQALKERSMRLMLDIVLNHCGSTNTWFTDAQADPNAPTADYFIWHTHPDAYEAWWNVRSLPKLDYTSHGLRKAMYGNKDSVVRHWLKEPYAIDGWRIDVANMMARQGPNQLGHKIGRALRRAIKSENAQAYMLGEHFYDGTSHLGGDELDASMNYRGFAFPTLQWLNGFDMAQAWDQPWADPARLPTEAYLEQLRTFRAAIPWQVAIQQFNVLNSHDTPRLLTMLDENIELFKVAVLLQMTYPGVACIYYGDEIGMTGGGDPYCRGCMPWDESQWNHDLRTWYQRIIAERRAAPALAEGAFQLVWNAEHGFAFIREHPAGSFLTIALREPSETITISLNDAALSDGTQLEEIGTGATATLEQGTFTLQQPHQASLWRIKTN